MTERNWHINSHHIRLNYRRYPGWRELSVDGEQVIRERQLFDRGVRHFFDMGDQEFEFVGVAVNGGEFAHFLIQDGVPIPSEEEAEVDITVADLLKNAGMGHPTYWQELTKATGLNYIPKRDSHFWHRHRLVGRLNERLISVHIDQPDGSKVVVSLIAHFPPTDEDLGDLQRKILTDDRTVGIIGSERNIHEKVGTAPAHIGFYLPYEPQKTTPKELAQKVQDFASLVGDYTNPLPRNWCAETQKTGIVKIASMNGFPVQMSTDAIAEREAWGTEMLDEGQKVTAFSLFGIGVGAIVALLGGFVWLLATLNLAGDNNSRFAILAAVAAPLALSIAVRVMYTISQLRVAWLWQAAMGFTVLGLFVAQWWASRRTASLISQGFSEGTLADMPALLLLALIATVWYGMRGYRNQQAKMIELYTPTIEILEGVA
jgi:hypothetical protein